MVRMLKCGIVFSSFFEAGPVAHGAEPGIAVKDVAVAGYPRVALLGERLFQLVA